MCFDHVSSVKSFLKAVISNMEKNYHCGAARKRVGNDTILGNVMEEEPPNSNEEWGEAGCRQEALNRHV